MSTLGRRFQNERERLGLSRKALAALCHYSTEQVRRVELDRAQPGAPLLAALAQAGGDVHRVLLGGARRHPAHRGRKAHWGEVEFGSPAALALIRDGFRQHGIELHKAYGPEWFARVYGPGPSDQRRQAPDNDALDKAVRRDDEGVAAHRGEVTLDRDRLVAALTRYGIRLCTGCGSAGGAHVSDPSPSDQRRQAPDRDAVDEAVRAGLQLLLQRSLEIATFSAPAVDLLRRLPPELAEELGLFADRLRRGLTMPPDRASPAQAGQSEGRA